MPIEVELSVLDLPSAAVAGRGHHGFGVAVRALDAARAAVVAMAVAEVG